MNKQIRWLWAETRRWSDEKIVSAEQAAAIRALYPEPATTISWGLVVFSSIGAVVVGLGIILLFAHNWQAIPKFGKLGIVLGALLAAHAGGVAVWRPEGWRRQLGEALCLLGSMLFGSGIWLVAQIYNIDEHFPTGFLLWGLGALAMAWALRSVPQGILAAILLTIWGGSERFEFGAPIDWSIPLVVAGLGPLAWRLRSALLTAFILAAVYLLLLFNDSFCAGANSIWMAAYALAVLLVAIGKLAGDNSITKAQRGVIAFFGMGGFVVCSYIRSFTYADDWGFETVPVTTDTYRMAVAMVYHWLPFVLAMGLWGLLLVRVWRGARSLLSIGDWIYPIALVYGQFFAATDYGQHRYYAGRSEHEYSASFIVFNLICLILAMTWMVRGCRAGRLRQTILGSLFFSMVVFGRYFDLPGTLASRGLVFIVLGGVMFAEGFYYRKLRREAEEEDRP